MHVVFMDEPGREKALILLFMTDQVRVHHQPRLKRWLPERIKTNEDSDANEAEGQAHGWEMLIIRSVFLIDCTQCERKYRRVGGC